MSRTLIPLTGEWLAMFPPVLREDPWLHGILNAMALEFERANAQALAIAEGLVPTTANEYTLPLWEALVGLPVNPPGTSVEVRRGLVLSRMLRSNGSGADWETRMAAATNGTYRYMEHDRAPMESFNLIPNPSVEVSTTGYTSTGSSAVTSRALVADYPWGSGTYVLHGTRAPGTAVVMLDGEIPVAPGEVYTFSVALNTGKVEAWFYSPTTSLGGAAGPEVSTPGQRSSVTFTIPADATFMQLDIRAASAVRTIVSDAWFLGRGASFPLPYWDGDTAGYIWTGTPHASASRTREDAAMVDPTVPWYTLRIDTALPAGVTAQALRDYVREITPANLRFDVEGGQTYEELRDDHTDYADARDDYLDYDNMRFGEA